MKEKLSQFQTIIDGAQHIVVIQADNPDADSLGSALALEHILGDMGKQVSLYCGVDIPGYPQYLPGWDRVSADIPQKFDASIIVDASTVTLLEKLELSGQRQWIAAKPCAVLDHHEKVENIIPYAKVIINEPISSTGELIHNIAKTQNWTLSIEAQACCMTAIMGDTQGLSNQLAAPATYRAVAEMIEDGVDRQALEERRREYSKMPPVILNYKGQLLERAKFSAEGAIVSIAIPQREINEFSPLYNPAPLVQFDMLQTLGVKVAIVFKHYQDVKVTGAIRCNPGYGVGADLAEHMGGGGHAFASGFKITGSKPFHEVEADCLQFATQLIKNIQDTTNETL